MLYRLAALGFGLCLVWKATLEPFAAAGFAPIAQVAVPLVAALFWRRLHRSGLGATIIWTAGAVGLVGTLALCYATVAAPFISEALVFTGSIAAYGSYAFFFLLWAEYYARLSGIQAAFAIGGSYVAASFLYYALYPLDPTLRLGIALVLPAVSASALSSCANGMPRAKREIDAWQTGSLRDIFTDKTFPWGIIGVVAIFAFAAGISRSSTNTTIDLLCVGLAGALAVGLAALAGLKGPGLTVYGAYKLTFGVMVTSLIVGTALGRDDLLAQLLIGIGQTLSTILLVLLLCDSTRRFVLPTIPVVAAARTLTGAAFLLGSILGLWAVESQPGTRVASLVYGATVVLLVATTFYWLIGSTWFSGQLDKTPLEKPRASDSACIAAERDGATGPDQALIPSCAPIGQRSQPASTASLELEALIEERGRTLAGEYRLSSRETDILVCLAWGKSAKRIEELMDISPNTVKTHVRHIYSKLGIHSRAELDVLLFGRSMR